MSHDFKNISFRLLAESDLGTLFDWLNRPHLRNHYQSTPISLAEVHDKFMPRLEPAYHVRSHIVLFDDQPIGKIQSYLIRDHQDFAMVAGQQEGAAIDLFIGDPAYRGRGIGRLMLRAYTQTVIPELFPGEHTCFICHALTNEAAIRRSTAAGFVPLRDVVEDGEASTLLALQLRPEASTPGR